MDESMQKYLEKAEVLIEALPYIRKFNRRIIVVKYGGSAMVDEELKCAMNGEIVMGRSENGRMPMGITIPFRQITAP